MGVVMFTFLILSRLHKHLSSISLLHNQDTYVKDKYIEMTNRQDKQQKNKNNIQINSIIKCRERYLELQ